VCLWWLYFKSSASAAGKALGRATTKRRNQAAVNAYSWAHIALIAGVVYIALGIEQVVAHLSPDQPRRAAGASLDWTSTFALYGGAFLYLTGRVTFLRFTVGSIPARYLVAAGVVLLLLPAARILPALAALGLLTAFLAALVLYEWLGEREQDPDCR
jgi:low temperature requirement protein LtrA